MSRRGEIVIGCGNPECFTEAIYRPSELRDISIESALHEDGWRFNEQGQDECPACVRERERREQPSLMDQLLADVRKHRTPKDAA